MRALRDRGSVHEPREDDLRPFVHGRVMPALPRAFHAAPMTRLLSKAIVEPHRVDGRDEPGHDDMRRYANSSKNPSFFCIGASSTWKRYAGFEVERFVISTRACVGTAIVS